MFTASSTGHLVTTTNIGNGWVDAVFDIAAFSIIDCHRGYFMAIGSTTPPTDTPEVPSVPLFALAAGAVLGGGWWATSARRRRLVK
jgi:hypothetical protein